MHKNLRKFDRIILLVIVWHTVSQVIFAILFTYTRRWPYAEANYRKALGQQVVVLQGMPVKGNHETRTLEFDSNNRVYVKYVLTVSSPRV